MIVEKQRRLLKKFKIELDTRRGPIVDRARCICIMRRSTGAHEALSFFDAICITLP
jgi:hypothetical protein